MLLHVVVKGISLCAHMGVRISIRCVYVTFFIVSRGNIASTALGSKAWETVRVMSMVL